MKDLFLQTAARYTPSPTLPAALWQELEKNYTSKKRHYHTLEHLENMLRLAAENREQVSDWEAFVFAIFYHDAVYNVLKSDNEERSAALAARRLAEIGFPDDRSAYCQQLILATKTHLPNADETCNLLMDIDLSILGADWERYAGYAAQIRREYSIYPDLIYKPGRRKVLEKFLECDFIFKTPALRERREAQARANLKREITSLT